MKSTVARIGLPIVLALTALLVAALPATVAAASQNRDRVCHLDATEKRKVANGTQQWLVRQLDRWCVRDGGVVSVRQTLEVETGAKWRLESKSGTTRMTADGNALSQGRFYLTARHSAKSCFPRFTGTLRPDGTASYEASTGC